ncbi:MAG TPA: M3 family metallopeptidase [Candidatus Baltobacteraceae bacterium]|nr:M3 family metallopeptidase [Candidatus Baltobacteraceae bacterium]
MTRIAALTLAAFACVSLQPISAAPARVDWNLTPAQIDASCTAAIAKAQNQVKDLIARRGPRTFSTVVLPLESLTSDLSDDTLADWFLFQVSTSKDVRDASLKCNNDESAFLTSLAASPQLYQALARAKRRGTARNVYDRKLTALWLDTFKRSGAGLPQTRRLEFVKLSNQLTDLQNRFQQNLGNDETTIAITAAQAASLPADFIAGLKKSGSGYAVPVNESTVSTFFDNERDEAARKAYYFAYNNRAGAANTQLLEAAIGIRDRLAHLEGYQSWAAFQLSDRMAKSPDRVMDFLNSLDARLLPASKTEVERLRQLKAKDTGDPNAVLQRWDFAYYDNMLRKTQYAVDQNEIRQYFPVQHTIDAVLNIYHTLLGVDFKQVTPTDAWNPDVIEYTVNDSKTGRFIGTTYFDLFPRAGKYGHFANFPLVPVRKNADGTYRPPVAAIVGNWPKPAPGHPALLSHDDVVTFFHEFGHNMAALLATAPYETLSNGFVTDFVEAPSQMLENFVWQPSVLRLISSNWKTGQPLPDELINALVRTRYVDDAYDYTGQIFYSEVDMAYHSSGPHVDTTAVWDKLQAQLQPLPPVQGIHPQASFGHLMGGYDAGYYGYLWSKVYAQDLFTAFQQGGLENPAVGMRYRQDILEPARTYDPDEEVQRFLGRPMNPNAFYQEFENAPAPAPTRSPSP